MPPPVLYTHCPVPHLKVSLELSVPRCELRTVKVNPCLVGLQLPQLLRQHLLLLAKLHQQEGR
jgi:hypothetical protein